MKKILMFQDYYYVGGIEKIIKYLKDNLNNNYKINILSFVNKTNNKIISLLNKDYRNFFIRNILGIFKLKKYLKNNQYDIIHIHSYNSFGLIYAYISKKYIKKIIIHAHNSNIDKDYLYIKHFINYIIKLLFYNKSYTYISVSEECSKFCFGNKKSIILPNMIDYSKYLFNNKERDYYRNLFSINKKDIIIGHIGRFEHQKNHDFIIDIFNDIIKINNNYKLILIGEGSLKNKIKHKVKKLNLESNIIFLDYRNDISKLINMFDIYLFPSLYEGFGITVLEAEINSKYVFVSDKISKSLKISNRIKYLSLNKSSLEWSKEIINLRKNKIKLNNNLDIANYIIKIKNIYEE